MRKVASIRKAMDYNWNYLIWVDIDSIVNKSIDDYVITESFQDTDVFYHQGKLRNKIDHGFETGVIGFNTNSRSLLNNVFNVYESKKYYQLKRWDDGYVFKHVITNENKIKSKDLSPNCTHDSPIKNSIWNNYITHKKGSHLENATRE